MMLDDFRYPQRSTPRELHALLAAALGGGFIAGAAYMGYGLWFEIAWMPGLAPIGAPRLSYGQEAGLLALVAAAVGAATGLGITRMLQSKSTLGVGLGIGFAVSGGFGGAGLWADQRARYGNDPSELILYPPLLVIVGTAILTMAVVGGVVAVSRLARGVGTHDIPHT